ncbi:MAG: cysteine-rich small domain-containing protein [Deferribacterales bacterium]
MSYKHFTNEKCEYYPCHKLDGQNCLFCYCPLYFFKDCGGDPVWSGNIKDCSQCVRNHDENSYEFIMERLKKAYANLRSGEFMLNIDNNKDV